MKLLVFDNYDSFTYNIVQLLREAGADDITVVRNDRIALEAVGRFDKIILSPGPGIPSEAGILLPLIREYASSAYVSANRRSAKHSGLRSRTSRMSTTASRAVSGLRRPTRFSQECQRNSMRDVTIRGSSAATDCRMNFKLRPKTKPDRSWPWHTGATTCAACSFIPNRYSRPTAGK